MLVWPIIFQPYSFHFCFIYFLLQEVESKDQQQTPKTLVGSTKQSESTATSGETTDKTSELSSVYKITNGICQDIERLFQMFCV